MQGAKIGEGIGCLAVFAVIGIASAIYFLIKIVIWCFHHVHID